MFKDESNGKQITEFVRLRAKCYTYDVEGKSTKDSKKCKGKKKGVVKKRLSINDYRRCVYSQESKLLPMNVIRSRKHELYSETINKIASSAAGDKRVIQGDLIGTLAIGHYCLAAQASIIISIMLI